MNINSNESKLTQGLTFDDVLLMPKYSEILPHETELNTSLTKKIPLRIPFISSAMDTVTEYKTAITMAQQGGIGIIHKNMSLDEHAKQVYLVKKSETALIADPIVIEADKFVGEALAVMRENNISGLPVVEGQQLIGILTGRDVRFEKENNKRIYTVMTKNVVTIDEGSSLTHAVELMHNHRIEKLPVIKKGTRSLVGMYTIKDIEKARKHPGASKDSRGRLLVGAAIGPGADGIERLEALVEKNCDLFVIDTAHAHSKKVIDTIKEIKRFKDKFDFCLIAGNIASGQATQALIDAGVDAIKVGIGPGSICTTRIVAGIGVPQLTAIMDCSRVAAKYSIPIIADGGIRFSGDAVKALACGASAIMIGSLFAGTDEAPGEIIIYQGKSYKSYRGMGSIGAMSAGSADRYFRDKLSKKEKFVPEGIEGRVPYKGPLCQSIHQLTGGLRSAMGYLGAKDLMSLRQQAEFIQITPASLRESHVHDVCITRAAPNYQVD
jgi:IMP dehydrogenase